MDRAVPLVSDEDDLHALWPSAVTAVLPDGKFAGRPPARPKDRTIVLGTGKAAARMAAAFEDAWARAKARSTNVDNCRAVIVRDGILPVF